MKPSARVQAAIDVLADIASHHRPASTALSDWGKTHRFAGSGDRAAIGNLVYDVLRNRALAAHFTQSDSPRALAIGTLAIVRQLRKSEIAALFDGSPHGPAPLSHEESERLDDGMDRDAADWQIANVPEWLEPSLQRLFGDRFADEGRALARRAPVDLRVNTLKATRDEVLAALAPFGAEPSELIATGVRIPAPPGDGRTPNVEAETAHGRGWFEVQDIGSQIAAALAGAAPGDRVLDLCAGAGGKSLAMAATMRNEGSIVAYDSDKQRLRPIFERLARSGATIVDVVDSRDGATLDTQRDSFDVVLVDAPCTGSGTWRRKPDAKWRLKPALIEARLADQRKVLARAADLVRPGGRLVYVTCSLLPEENTEQIAAFVSAHPEFALEPWRDGWRRHIGTPPPTRSADGRDDALLLTPATHGTDGFFVAALSRRV